MKSISKSGIVGACLLGGAALTPLAAQGDAMALLSKLEPGQWAISSRDGGPTKSICLRDAAELVQLRHGSASCSRYVVEENADRLTVQYTCKGNGYGRTSIRRETGGLVQIESQGVAAGRPFQFHAEARRTGACR